MMALEGFFLRILMISEVILDQFLIAFYYFSKKTEKL